MNNTTLPSVQQDTNQPQIKTQHTQSPSLSPQQQSLTHQHQHEHNNSCSSHNHQHNHNNDNSEPIHSKQKQAKRSIQMIKQIKLKHPDCIPVFYVKHEASPKQFPSPKIPFILFNKELKIEQAMYNLYNQIQIKGLYFFCTRVDKKDNKMKYVILKPGQTIQQIYNKYGKDDHLTLIYGDKTIGMGGANKMEKWLVRIMILLLSIWVLLMAFPLYLSYQQGGFPAVYETLSLMWKRSDHIDKKTQNQNETLSTTKNETVSYQTEGQHVYDQQQMQIGNQDLQKSVSISQFNENSQEIQKPQQIIEQKQKQNIQQNNQEQLVRNEQF